MFRSIRVLLGLIVALGLGACSAAPIRLYDGPRLAPDQVAVVSMPEALEVARVNGVEVKGAGGMLKGGDRILELAPGRYELLIFYREVWDQTGEHDVLRSNPALFVIDAKAGHRYRIAYAQPKRHDQAQILAADFSGWAVDEADGSRFPSQASGLKFRDGLMAAISGSNELVADAQNGRSAQTAVAPLAMPVPPLSAATPVVPPVAGTPPAAAAPSAELPLLMRAWWKQATPEERRDFLRWVAGQP